MKTPNGEQARSGEPHAGRTHDRAESAANTNTEVTLPSETHSQHTALYIRVSTEKQDTGAEAQERALIAYCTARNVSNFRIYTDKNVSGTKTSRPELDRLMQAVRAGEVSQVIVFSFSRFARSVRHLLTAMDEFTRLDVAFVSLSEQLDTKSPMGKAVFTILAAISELERDLIVQRVKNGLVNAKAKGKRIGRPKTRPSELIRALAADGKSYRRIAQLANVSYGAVAAELKNLNRSESEKTDQRTPAA